MERADAAAKTQDHRVNDAIRVLEAHAEALFLRGQTLRVGVLGLGLVAAVGLRGMGRTPAPWGGGGGEQPSGGESTPVIDQLPWSTLSTWVGMPSKLRRVAARTAASA